MAGCRFVTLETVRQSDYQVDYNETLIQSLDVAYIGISRDHVQFPKKHLSLSKKRDVSAALLI
jgi:hypothetical protein